MNGMSAQTQFALPSHEEKPQYVQGLFQRIASHYDLMNDVMTLGLHRLWKRQACRLLQLKPGDSVLDVCCGTGDLALGLKRLFPDVSVTGLDFCEDMLVLARQRAEKSSLGSDFLQGDALALPFEDNRFDGVVI